MRFCWCYASCYHSMQRTPKILKMPFHGGNTGSNPVGDAKSRQSPGCPRRLNQLVRQVLVDVSQDPLEGGISAEIREGTEKDATATVG
jgi:hypothetical protein